MFHCANISDVSVYCVRNLLLNYTCLTYCHSKRRAQGEPSLFHASKISWIYRFHLDRVLLRRTLQCSAKVGRVTEVAGFQRGYGNPTLLTAFPPKLPFEPKLYPHFLRYLWPSRVKTCNSMLHLVFPFEGLGVYFLQFTKFLSIYSYFQFPKLCLYYDFSWKLITPLSVTFSEPVLQSIKWNSHAFLHSTLI